MKSIQKNILLYTNNKLAGKEIKNTIPFIIALKIPRKNLTMEIKDLYGENYDFGEKN